METTTETDAPLAGIVRRGRGGRAGGADTQAWFWEEFEAGTPWMVGVVEEVRRLDGLKISRYPHDAKRDRYAQGRGQAGFALAAVIQVAQAGERTKGWTLHRAIDEVIGGYLRGLEPGVHSAVDIYKELTGAKIIARAVELGLAIHAVERL